MYEGWQEDPVLIRLLKKADRLLEECFPLANLNNLRLASSLSGRLKGLCDDLFGEHVYKKPPVSSGVGFPGSATPFGVIFVRETILHFTQWSWKVKRLEHWCTASTGEPSIEAVSHNTVAIRRLCADRFPDESQRFAMVARTYAELIWLSLSQAEKARYDHDRPKYGEIYRRWPTCPRGDFIAWCLRIWTNDARETRGLDSTQSNHVIAISNIIARAARRARSNSA